jgi:hypothetical protein
MTETGNELGCHIAGNSSRLSILARKQMPIRVHRQRNRRVPHDRLHGLGIDMLRL